VGGVWGDGSTISTKLLQSSTNGEYGPEAVVRGWVEAISAYLAKHEMSWNQVNGVGLAIPGPV
jgi:glucokinase